MAFVQAITATAIGASSVTTASITTTTGNLFVVNGGTYSSTSFAATPVTDNKSNGYTQGPADSTDGGSRCGQYYKTNGSGGSGHTFTVSLASAGDCGVTALEFSNEDTSSPFDQSAGGGEITDTTTHTSNTTGTTTQANEILVFGFCTGDNAGASLTGSSGWTVPTNGYADSGGVDIGGGYQIVSATGTYTASCISATLCRSAMVIGTYKEATGGGGPTLRLLASTGVGK